MTAAGAVWRNWSRTESVRPARVERPADAGAVVRAVQAARRNGMLIKPVGAGHSFTGIAIAPGVQLDLDDLTGLVAVDRMRGRVTLRAGTRLHRLPALLEPLGLAMENLGDIDRQTIAGAVSTGTHGTGGRFGGLATQVTGVTLVTGEGEMLTVSEEENAELLPAVRLGLGALGVLVDVTLQCVPAFVLAASERAEPLDAVLDDFDTRVDEADHFEFYWFPHTDIALTKTNTRLPADARRAPLSTVGRLVQDELLSNAVYAATCAAGRVLPAVTPRVNRTATRLFGSREFADQSTAVFTSRRRVRFREMEYAIPRAHAAEALRRIRSLIEQRGWRISFPVEVRAAAADENWLSTAHGRDSAYIAVHRYIREDEGAYFRAVEEIMRDYDGRPHWGKLHYRVDEELRALYPRFGDFLAVRDRLDPHRLFSNSYLQRVLGA
ncbi:FAD-binding protein [Microbacteriaceae bacterium VKM Ac-2855]|nr:FAD-binding protein [Microbacteriaceae bacterium VKM Ac-2855]